jgi:hypothetical protein
LCKDLTNEFQQQKLIEEIKKKSEQILLQILPKDIISRLNRGEKDIAFTVPLASIIFIDIVQFSKYMETLNSSAIMNNLSQIFGAYDKLMTKHSLITKLSKLEMFSWEQLDYLIRRLNLQIMLIKCSNLVLMC